MIHKKVTLPFLMSVNQMWRKGKNSVYLSENARKVKKIMNDIFEPKDEEDKKYFNSKVLTSFSFKFKSVENKDVDNYVKLPMDSIKERLIQDDTQVDKIILMKEISHDENEHIDIRIGDAADSFIATLSAEDIFEIYAYVPHILSRLILTEQDKYNICTKYHFLVEQIKTEYSTIVQLILDKEYGILPFIHIELTSDDEKRILKGIDSLEDLEKIAKFILINVATLENKRTKLRRAATRNAN